MKFEDQKKSVSRSRRLTVIDLVIILAIVTGLTLFYRYSADRAVSLSAPETTVTKLKQGKVIFFDSENKKNLEILVEIAENDYQQAKGLMFREDIPENQGMLFTYEEDLQRYFWMKNTTVPLDIIFVDATLKIIKIHKNTQPNSDQLYPSEKPAKFVVEVRSGFTDRYGIETGNQILWEYL